MSDLRVCICLLTYGGSPERRDYAYKTLDSVLENVWYDGPLSVHIADDGSPPQHVDTLINIAEGFNCPVTTSSGDRGGYGRNYNVATQIIHLNSEIIMPIEDDWQLLCRLDLEPYVRSLSDGRVGCIRLGYLGATQELKGSVLILPDQTLLAFDPDSAEPHVFAGHPRIETVTWERSVGPWPEGEDPGITEFMVAHMRAARMGVAWPIGLRPGALFAHIGTKRSTEP